MPHGLRQELEKGRRLYADNLFTERTSHCLEQPPLPSHLHNRLPSDLHRQIQIGTRHRIRRDQLERGVYDVLLVLALDDNGHSTVHERVLGILAVLKSTLDLDEGE